jgi:cytochrome c peroxidase
VADGTEVYVARFVTAPLPNEFSESPVVEQGGQYYGGEVMVVNAASLLQQDTIVLRWSPDLASEHDGPGVPNYLGAPVISPDGLGAWVPSKQDNILGGGLRAGSGLSFDQTVRAVSSKIDLVAGDEVLTARIDHDNASVANYAAFGPYGVYLYTTLEGNREVAVSNVYTGIEILRFDAGRAPQGVAVSPDGNRLYVNNFMDRTVGVYDISQISKRNVLEVNEIAIVSSVTTEALTPTVLLGKQIFYDARDPRLSAGPYMSCASCHNDGGADGRTWDFTHMGEGLRTTIGLEGRSGMGHGLLHWSANFDEVQDFEGQIRNFSGGTGLMSDTDFFSGTRFHPLGDAKAGFSADLDALAAYVSSLNRVPNSPYRNADGTFSTQGETGKLVFESEGCGDCHTPASYTDSSLPDPTLHDIGTLTSNSGKRLGGSLNGIDTPTLLGVWSNAPYLHDGSALDLTEAIAAHAGVSLTAQELEELAVFLQELDNVTGNACVDCLNFAVVATNSYSNQDEYGHVSVENAGLTLALEDNTQRKSVRTFNITANTVLEFDFESTSEGEIQAIGFDEDNNFNNGVRTFKVYGTQNWNGANNTFDNYTGGVVHYSIPVGQYFTGAAMHLVVSNDDDAGSGLGSNARFSNVRIVTAGNGNLSPTINSPGLQITNQFDSVSLTMTGEDPNIGDTLSFSSGGTLPPGLSISSSGNITGTATVNGDYPVTITASDGKGGSAQTTFQWSVCNGETGCGATAYLDFTTLPTVSYSNQDNHGNVTVLDGGATILLADNTQRRTTQTFTITANTVLEFDYESSDEPEVGGIGFDENNSYNDGQRVFKVHGTQNWNGDIDAFNNYSGAGTQHYVIPVGQYYTGIAMYLVFMNDDDAGTGLGSNSRFSNVQVYEAVP